MGYKECALQRRLCSSSPLCSLLVGCRGSLMIPWNLGVTTTFCTTDHPQRFSEGWEQAQELHKEWLCSWSCRVGLRAGLHQCHHVGSAPLELLLLSPDSSPWFSIILFKYLSTCGQAALAQPQVFHGSAARGFHGITEPQAGLGWQTSQRPAGVLWRFSTKTCRVLESQNQGISWAESLNLVDFKANSIPGWQVVVRKTMRLLRKELHLMSTEMYYSLFNRAA